MEEQYFKKNWFKYVAVFFITCAIFFFAASLSSFFTSKKVEDMKNLQNNLQIDILSSETQFALLSELSCAQSDLSILSDQLSELASKIEYSENNFKNNEDVLELKKYYTILQIKDFILVKKINERCGNTFAPLLYFYTTAENCTECMKQGFALTELRRKYPDVRVYSFDYNLDLSALSALMKIYKIEDTKLPAVVIKNKVHTGFQSMDDLKLKLNLKDIVEEVKE
jgi:hypothetical protein